MSTHTDYFARRLKLALLVVFLAGVIGLGAVASNAGDQTVSDSLRGAVVTPSTVGTLGTLDPGKVREFVVRVDALLDRLEQMETAPSDYDTLTWAIEILPYFEYERVRNGVVLPDLIKMTPYFTGMEHNHILGRARCAGPNDIPVAGGERPYPYVIELNMRLENLHSSWFADPGYLSTLIHELAHIQGACGHGASDEHAAQVITVEILSALVLGGNREALYPLLDEIRSWGMSYLLHDAINLNDGSEEKLAEYAGFRDRVYGNAFESARSEKALRFWKKGRSHLASNLHTYGVTPFVKLVEGLEAGSVPLVIPAFEESGGRRPDGQAYRGSRNFEVDDFAAFIEIVEALVAQAEVEQAEAAEEAGR